MILSVDDNLKKKEQESVEKHQNQKPKRLRYEGVAYGEVTNVLDFNILVIEVEPQSRSVLDKYR